MMKNYADDVPELQRQQVSLQTLPPELLLRISSYLSPQSILRLSQTSSHFLAVCRSPQVFKELIAEIDPLSKTGSAQEAASDRGGEGGSATWWQEATFLCTNGSWLGYFISSTAYTSRLIRLELSHTSPTPTIHAIQLVPYNDLNYPHALPSGAVLSQLRGSYRLFRGPDSGFSHSLLHPQLNFVDLFNIDQSTGALLGPPAQSIRISSARLKLRLERVERVIGEERVERMDDARGMARTGMMALLMGRLSPKEWPTKHLLGTERGGKQIGALRGVSDWISGRGEERELVEKEGITVVEGFKLQIRRKIIQLPGAFPGPARAAMGERRRGVGADGGPAVLWHGEERDPDGGAGVAIVRAGGGATGSEELVFHLPTGEEEEDIGEELVPGSHTSEEFFPVRPPARPLSFNYPPCVDSSGEILAASLEGLWVGTYGPHGLEFGYITIELERIVEDSAIGDEPISLGTTSSSPARFSRRAVFTKLTGDQNVPSGQARSLPLLPDWRTDDPLPQKSWSAALPDVDLDPTAPISLGTIPSVTNETLLRWSSYDPDSSSPIEAPRWEEGVVPAAGQIAMAGFVQPSWTPATVRFIRSSTTVSRRVRTRDGSGDEREETKDVESVEEIRMRWEEMGLVSCFRRVRV